MSPANPTAKTYAALNRAFAFFNDRLFGGELPGCLVTLQRKNKAYGYFAGGRFGSKDGAEITDATLVYFDGTLPPGLDPSAEATSSDGRYAGLDVPPTATRVEAWGSLDGSAPSPIACEPLQVEPDTLTVLVLRPTRADAPPACARR